MKCINFNEVLVSKMIAEGSFSKNKNRKVFGDTSEIDFQRAKIKEEEEKMTNTYDLEYYVVLTKRVDGIDTPIYNYINVVEKELITFEDYENTDINITLRAYLDLMKLRYAMLCQDLGIVEISDIEDLVVVIVNRKTPFNAEKQKIVLKEIPLTYNELKGLDWYRVQEFDITNNVNYLLNNYPNIRYEIITRGHEMGYVLWGATGLGELSLKAETNKERKDHLDILVGEAFDSMPF